MPVAEDFDKMPGEFLITDFKHPTYGVRLKKPGPKQTHFLTMDLWRVAYRSLYCLIGEKPVAIVFSFGWRQIVETAHWMRENLGYEIIWATYTASGLRYEHEHGLIGCDATTIARFLELRKRRDNVVMICVHMAASHMDPWRLKRLVKEAKVVSIVHDPIDLWVPEQHYHLWDAYDKSKGSNRAEYLAYKEVISGEYIDGIVYKDWGPNWPYLANCKCPTAWMPSGIPEELYQEPPKLTVPDRFAYIGTLVPKSTHDRESKLFADIMLEDIFERTAKLGFEIHAYILKPAKEVAQLYRDKFSHGPVKLFKGEILTDLLPRLQGRYKWGWMLYEFPQPIIMQLIRNTLPVKLFTYLALGIPPVVISDMQSVCRIVKEHDCGVIVTHEELPDLKRKLAEVDYEKLLANVVKARKRYSLNRHLSTLGYIVKQAMKAKPRPIPEIPAWMDAYNAYIKKRQEEAPTTPAGGSWVDREGAADLG